MSLSTQEVKRRSVRGVLGYGLRTGFLYVISIVATGLLGVYLSPAEFGTYFVVTSLIGLFTFISDIGLAATLIQKKEEPTKEELRTTFTVQQILAIVIVLIIIGLSPLWKSYAQLTADGLLLLYALGFSFILASLKTIPSILLERQLAFDKLIIPQVIENITFYVTAVILARNGYGVMSYTYAVLIRSVSGLITIYMLQRWSIGLAISKEAFKNLVHFGVKFQLNDFLARIKDDLFIVVLARFLAPQDMGIIGWAKRWSMFPYQLSVNSVVAITFPTYSRLQERKDLLKKAIEKSIFFISLLIFPVLAGMVLLATPLTELIPNYQKWQPALFSLFFFSINIAFSAVSTPLTNTLNAIGKIGTTLKLMLFWTIATWALTPICIYYFGYHGVAIASALISTSSVITVYLVKRVVPISLFDQLWRQIASTTVMALALLSFSSYWSQSFLHLGLAVVSGGGIYVLSMVVLGYTKIKSEVISLWQK
jgi:O-antigen/teichoic acid export membrane protein